jgi:hypothetical protein
LPVFVPFVDTSLELLDRGSGDGVPPPGAEDARQQIGQRQITRTRLETALPTEL